MEPIKKLIKQQLSIIADANREIDGMLDYLNLFDVVDNLIEQWKCVACGNLPCIVTIHDTSSKEASGYELFTDRSCLCKHDTPDWKQIKGEG